MNDKKNMPLSGVGTDIIEIRRIKEAVDRHGEPFLERIFTTKEILYCKRFANAIPHFAGRFAAKEAIVKSLGTGFQFEMTWKDVEILNNALGKPEVFLSERLRKTFPNATFFLSISHCNDYATATAIVVGL